MSDWTAPPEPPEGSNRLNAKDLKGHVVVLHPISVGEETGKDGKPWRYVTCDVWQIDRAGIVERDSEVRVSWWRAYEQLKQVLGQYVPCKIFENEDRSVTLNPISQAAQDVIAKVRQEIEHDASVWAGVRDGETPAESTAPESYGDEEPF